MCAMKVLLVAIALFAPRYATAHDLPHSDSIAERERSTPLDHAHTNASTTSDITTARGLGLYKLVDKWAGDSFWDGWDFFTDPDPSHGSITYVSGTDAVNLGLAYVQPHDKVVVMKVDNTTDLDLGAKRNSVRITSKKAYDGGLFVLDMAAAPYGCSVWPSFFTFGPNRPVGGQIDIFEGVHLGPTDQYTLHNAAGCSIDPSPPPGYRVLPSASKLGVTDCGPSTANSGCYFVDQAPRTYGETLKAEGGGVIAVQWNKEGLRIWNFARHQVPLDLVLGVPLPNFWPQSNLRAAWPSTTCDTATYFHQHRMVFDITLCGGWGGGTFAAACAGLPGVEATCAEQVMKAANFGNAQWKIHSVAVYQ